MSEPLSSAGIAALSEEKLQETNSFKLSIREMRLRCQSTAAAPERETFTGRRLIRPVSIYLTRLWLKTPITPNQITFLSVMVFFIGLGFFFHPGRSWALIGSFIVYLNAVLDACDGEVARFRKTTSVVGGSYAEPVSHDVQYGLMYLPLGLAMTLQSGSIWPLFAGAVAGISKLLTRLIDQRYWLLTQPTMSADQILTLRQTYKSRPAWRRAIAWFKRNLFTSSGLILPLAFVSALGLVSWYVYFYAACFATLWVVTFVRQLRGLRTAAVQKVQSAPGASE